MRLRFAGHPLHPALVHFPIALWSVAVAAEAGGWLGGQALWWSVSLICHALGTAAGLLALVAGFLDYLALEREHPAQDTAVWHMLAMCLAWLLFVLSLALRGLQLDAAPPGVATVLAGAGFAVMAAGGWLGGRLVYHYGVAVRRAGGES